MSDRRYNYMVIANGNEYLFSTKQAARYFASTHAGAMCVRVNHKR
jgi:hypothetical protein